MTKKKPTHYVFSTLTASQEYTRTASGANDLPVTEGSVFIAGGSNIPDKYMRTSIGVATPVNDEELQILEENEVFRMHKENGFITVRPYQDDAEKVAADMITRDQSAPLVDADFEDATPVTNTPANGKSRKA